MKNAFGGRIGQRKLVNGPIDDDVFVRNAVSCVRHSLMRGCP